jgi:hypothetical protein
MEMVVLRKLGVDLAWFIQQFLYEDNETDAYNLRNAVVRKDSWTDPVPDEFIDFTELKLECLYRR